MIIYRPHRGGLRQAMEEAKEFETIEAMKEFIVKKHTCEAYDGPAFNADDIVISEPIGEDRRIGWEDTMRICINRYNQVDLVKEYGAPQCIGHCASDYGSMEQSQRMCKEFLSRKPVFSINGVDYLDVLRPSAETDRHIPIEGKIIRTKQK